MKIRTFGRAISLGLGLISLAGCGAEEDGATSEASEAPTSGRTDACPTGKCDSPNSGSTFEHVWAVDMKKVREHYGQTTRFFFGMTPQEAGLDPQIVIPGLTQAIAAQMIAAGVPQEAAVQAATEQATALANTPIWDQMARRNADHSLHVDHALDDRAAKNVQLILEDGTEIDPPGYLNIIPMYRDTDPTKQTQIRKVMKNGDVIVYFHPEFTDIKDHMERRMSHVAMHYDIMDPVTGQQMVHHIDNPNGYGPMYNHRPSKHMPFHIFRFQPRADKPFGLTPDAADVVEEIEGVAFTQAQRQKVLALVNPTLPTEAATLAFHTRLDVELALDVRAADNIVTHLHNVGAIGNLATLAAIPYVGPSALTRMRDAVDGEEDGFTIEPGLASLYSQHAADWAFITNDLSPFADFFTLTLQQKSQLDDFAVPALNGEDMPRLYCSGLAYTNLNLALNRPLNPLGLGDDLWDTFKGSQYYLSDINARFPAEWVADSHDLPAIDRLVFESYAATDIVNSWLETNFGHLPLPIRQAMLQNPQLQQQMVNGFSQLEWSDADATEKSQAQQFDPASEANVARWAKAYGLTAEQTPAFLEADAELKAAFSGLGISAEGLTPMDVLQAVERETVANRFVPPRIWMDVADRADSNMVYVGTVLNCELLTAADGSGLDACAGGGGGADEFAEGAADTSTYPHYAVTDGGERTHRRLDGTPGPELMGKGTRVTAAFTAADVTDVRFLLHTPEHYEGHETADMAMYAYDEYCTERNPSATCAPAKGILIDPTRQIPEGAVSDERLAFDLLGDEGICTALNETEMECEVATRGPDGALSVEKEILDRDAHGLFSLTMIDLKASAAPAELELCEACAEGGAQFNGWRLQIRND